MKGAVYRAIKKLDKREYAVKVITISPKDENKQAILAMSNNEKRILNSIRDICERGGKHAKHVIQYLDGEDYLTPDEKVEVRIVFDYFHFDLPLLIEKRLKGRPKIPYFSSTKVLELAQQIRDGLVFLHDNNIAHLDVKPGNILGRYTSTDTVHLVIADFGTATDKADKLVTGEKGTVAFQAPEIMSKAPYDPILADAYSFGLTIHCLITADEKGAKPPLDYANSQLAELPSDQDLDPSIYSDEQKKTIVADRQVRWENKKKLMSIVDGCVISDPTTRTKLSKILKQF